MKKLISLFLFSIFFMTLSYSPLIASTYIVDANPSCSLFGTCTNCMGVNYSLFSPGNNKTTIKAAIDAATNDWSGPHSIKICSGSYNESNIDFDSSALNNSIIESVTGNRDDVHIYANSNNPILKITQYISSMTLRNLSIENTSTNGRGISHNNGSLQNTVFQNLSIISKAEAFYTENSQNITLQDSDLTSTNSHCFYAQSPTGTITINTLNKSYNTFTCKNSGIYLGDASQNYFLLHTKITTTASNAASITLSKANILTIDDVDINSSNEGSGIWVDGTVNSVIIKNSKIHNIKNEAIYFKSIKSSGSIFENNVIDSGTRGIYLKDFSNPVTIRNNIIQNTGYGIYLLDNASWRGSQIDSNCFLANTNHAFSRDQNAHFDNGTEGNYWDTWSSSNAYAVPDIPKFDNYPRSYCPLMTIPSECQALDDGYHIINPFGITEKKFEIYCKNKKNYLMLPFYNSIAPNSNFLFTSNPIGDNYYNPNNAKKAIKMLEVSFDKQNNHLKIKKIIYEDSTEGYDFSNLNLIGTPFAFVAPRDTSTIKQCSADNTSRLRVGMNQVLKINPKASGYSRACLIDEPSLRFLPDYRFLEFEGSESLFLDCANLASNTTTEQIPEVTGSFFIDPKRVGRNHTQRDRPFVASCKYQSDLNQAWTFVLALDGYTTTTKNDATNKTDTCSKLGLTFFIPDSKTTFGRVRQFLFDSQPSEWGNYVGTVKEYFTDNAITGWATDNQVSELKPNPIPNGLMWPYGPMGIYRPANGAGGNNDKKMPKSPQYLTANEITKGFGSLQETGWRSLYYDYHGDGNITKDLWWVADIAAGYRADLSAQNPKPVEPNGDYDANNWLGWFTDTNGNVVHYNDQNTVNGQYRYSNYMCMSYANVDKIVRYQPVAGAFDIIERNVLNGQEINNRFIQTKVVKAPITLDMIILKDDKSALQPDKNVSVGIFLNDIEIIGNTETPRDISYIGDIRHDNNGSLSNHKPTGRFTLPTLSHSSASQKLFFKFKYCNRNDFEWTDCWIRNGNSASCKPEQALQCKSVDSDYFAVRPDKFDISLIGTSPNLLKAGEDYSMSIIAKEYNSANPTAGYNQSRSKLTIQIPPSKLFRDGTIDLNNTLQGILTVGATNYDFINGITNEMTINFTDVGRISFDINDSEWAKVDIPDTSEINRTIQGDVNVTFIPYHFAVSNLRITNTRDSNFTYISNDLNMSAHLDFTITAQNKQGNATQNFSNGLYENNISILPSIIDNSRGEANKSLINSLSLGFIAGTKSISWNEANTSQNIFFNFTRPTVPINPFDINNSEVNLSIESLYTDNGTSAIVENNTTNKNGMTNGTIGSATFYYGRVHAPDQRFNGTNGTANIYYEVYCRDCTSAFRTSMGINGHESVDAINWYQNNLHVNNTFGEFNTTAPTTTVGGLTLGTRTLFTQNLTATSTPHVNRINFSSSSWLRYFPEYFSVSFTHTGSQWGGEGSVDRNTSGNVGKITNENNITRSNKRLSW